MFDIHPFQMHVEEAYGHGVVPDNAVSARAGSRSECGREITFSLALVGGRIEAGYDCYGCTAMTAVGSAVCTLIEDMTLLEAGTIGADEIATELGGLQTKRYAAEFAADALGWALGALVMAQPKLDTPINDRAAIALSGGVDSAVAAHLLRERGLDLVALTVELWRDDQTDSEKSCCSASAVRLARKMAHESGMAHFTIDLRDEFRAGVVAPWLQQARDGQVGNPCVNCNGHVRIDGMLTVAQKLGFGQLATGHYSNIVYGDVALLRANEDANRDQSYMLAAVAPATLARLLFPLGGMDKSRVRKIAHEAGIRVADRPDSQDLCFLAGEGKMSFLGRVGGLTERPGPIMNTDGERVGTHRGMHFYTIGQRKSLPIDAGNHFHLRVVDIRPQENALVVGTHEDLLTDTVTIAGVRIYASGGNSVRLRSHGDVFACELRTPDGNIPEPGFHRELQLHFSERIEPPHAGQSVCLMADDLLVGQGVVKPRVPVAV